MTTLEDSLDPLLGSLQKPKDAPSTADHRDLVEEVPEAAYDIGEAAYKTTSDDSPNALLRSLLKLKEAPSTVDHTDLVEEVLEAAYDIVEAAYKTTSDNSPNALLRSLLKLKLKEAPSTADHTDLVEEVLAAAYNDEEIQIVSLINDTAEQIEAAVFEIGLKFDIDRAPYNLLLRSGLQFIVDYLKNIQNGRVSSSGQKALQYWEDNDGIETFDEGIENWKGCNGFTGEYVVHSYEDLCKPAWVPESHSWWFDVKEEDSDDMLYL